MNGFNACVFAYGQTGSGKTYSVFGRGGNSEKGLIPRAIEYLYDVVERRKNYTNISMFVSFLEIYMDCVVDLGKVLSLKNVDVSL